jgi:peptidoglycan/xylan/chitin deacetylase (PgdA/CDA1 family)
LYRPPYAVHNPTVVEVAHEEKVVVVEYDIASGDSDKTLSEDAVLKDLMEKIRPGSIVIFHMNGNGVHTASLIRRLVPWLRKQGLKPVTVGALVKHDLGHPGADKSR